MENPLSSNLTKYTTFPPSSKMQQTTAQLFAIAWGKCIWFSNKNFKNIWVEINLRSLKSCLYQWITSWAAAEAICFAKSNVMHCFDLNGLPVTALGVLILLKGVTRMKKQNARKILRFLMTTHGCCYGGWSIEQKKGHCSACCITKFRIPVKIVIRSLKSENM